MGTANGINETSDLIVQQSLDQLGKKPGDTKAAGKLAREVKRRIALKRVRIGEGGMLAMEDDEPMRIGDDGILMQEEHVDYAPEQPETALSTSNAERIDYESKSASGKGHWITIGAKDHHGGTPVYIENGRITKGHPSLHGKKIANLSEPAEHSEHHKKLAEIKARPTGTDREESAKQKEMSKLNAVITRSDNASGRSYAKASLEKKARKLGIDKESLHSLAAEMKAHHDATASDIKSLLQTARDYAKRQGINVNHMNRQFHGGDSAGIAGFDSLARQLAGEYPHILGAHGYSSEEGYDEDATAASEKLFELLQAGNPELMSEEQAYEEAFDHLASQVQAQQPMHEDAVPFAVDENGHWVTLENGQHVFIGGDGVLKPSGPGGKLAKRQKGKKQARVQPQSPAKQQASEDDDLIKLGGSDDDGGAASDSSTKAVMDHAVDLVHETSQFSGIVNTEDLKASLAKAEGPDAADEVDGAVQKLWQQGKIDVSGQDDDGNITSFSFKELPEQKEREAPEDLKDYIIQELPDMIAREKSGLFPIHELRAHIKAASGKEAASHAVLDPLLFQMWREGHLEIGGISNLSRGTEQQLNDSITQRNGEQKQTFYWLEKPQKKPDQQNFINDDGTLYYDDATEDEARKRAEAFARIWQERQVTLSNAQERPQIVRYADPASPVDVVVAGGSVHQPINLTVYVTVKPAEPAIVNVSPTPVTVNVSPTPITVQPAPVTVQAQPPAKKTFVIEKTEDGKMVGKVIPNE